MHATRTFLFLLSCCALLLLAACVKAPAPTDDQVGAVVGNFSIELTKKFYDMTQGDYDNGIWLTLTSREDGTQVKATTNRGYFVFYNLAPGTYDLTNWHYKQGSTWVRGEDEHYNAGPLTVTPGSVAVAGNIHAVVGIGEAVGGGSIPFDFERVEHGPVDMEALREHFRKDDEAGAWSGRTWTPAPQPSE